LAKYVINNVNLILLLLSQFFVPAARADFRDCQKLIQRLVNSSDESFSGLSRLKDLETETAQGSLLEVEEKSTSKRVAQHNREILSALKDPVVSSNPNSVSSISRKEANYLVNLITNHPVNGHKKEKKYDPEECFGFCFGRATLVHNEALRRGVDPEAIKKIWAVGSLEKGKWHFHVATMIKSKGNGSWWVVDTIYAKAINAETWIERMRNSADEKRVMIFVTDPRRFSVADPKQYTDLDLLGDGKSDYYRGYFKDYLEFTARQKKPKPFSKN
jgi:hypothetical protein